jgi:hypothetical protein
MATASLDIPDYHPDRGVTAGTDGLGDLVVRIGTDGVEIVGDPAGLRDLARVVSGACCSGRAERKPRAPRSEHRDVGCQEHTVVVVARSAPLVALIGVSRVPAALTAAAGRGRARLGDVLSKKATHFELMEGQDEPWQFSLFVYEDEFRAATDGGAS